MSIYELMEAGLSVPAERIEKEYQSLKEWRDVYEKRGMTAMVERVDVMVETLLTYKPFNLKDRKRQNKLLLMKQWQQEMIEDLSTAQQSL